MRWRALRHAVLAAISCLQATALAADPDTPAVSTPTATLDQPTDAFAKNEHILLAALEQCSPLDSQGRRPDGSVVRRPRVVSAPQFSSAYPVLELHRGNSAIVQLTLLVDAFGNVRFPHVAYSVPINLAQDFADAALRVARGSGMSPMMVDGRATASWGLFPVKFLMNTHTLLNQEAWTDVLAQARHGDTLSLEKAAYVWLLLRSETGLDQVAGDTLLIDSALHGEEHARIRLIQKLSECSKATLVDQWIFDDANAGSSAAQLMWADILIESHDPQFVPKASELLHKVIASPEPFMRLWSSGLMATSPIDGLRDPALALQVASSLNHDASPAYATDPDYAEALAAALAANSKYAEAVTWERKAIQRARSLGWNVSSLQTRLESYRAQKPWRGYLCDCDRLSPDEQ